MLELRFTAGIHSVEEENTAVFYVMNTTVNRNGWAVSDQALEHALPTIIGKPLRYGADYKTDRHYDKGIDIGFFTYVHKPDGYALAQAKITDEEAWRMLSTGEWGPISVVVTSYLERCSECGAELTRLENPFAHPCILKGGHLVIESFVFNHVDFIDVPAYPQAGLIGTVNKIPIELLAGVFSLSNTRALDPGAVSQSSRRKYNLDEERYEDLKADVNELREKTGPP